CPMTPYYVPYPVYPVYYPPPVAYYPMPMRYLPPPKPRYAPDPQRSTALVLSAIAFGVGTVGAGTMYLEQKAHNDSCFGWNGCGSHHDRVGEKTALWTMGAFASIP